MEKLIFLESIVDMPMIRLPVRSVYVSVKGGGVLVSPGSRLSDEQLSSVGTVTDLVAPNLFHCAGISKARSMYANAKVWGVPGAKSLKSEISWTNELSKESWPYSEELPMIHLKGMPNTNEVVFFHAASRSLIVTDLCFHLLDVKGFVPWMTFSLFGTYKKFAISKFFLRGIKDKDAFEKSLSEIFSYDFDNVILSHGDNVIGDGKAKLMAALKERNLKIG